MDRALAGIGLVFALGLALALHLVGLAAVESADFTFVNGTEPRTLDPGLMTGEPEGRIADALFEGLVRRDARTLRAEPGVAERWEISPDGRTIRFFLRSDALWSDGSPVTAHDFAASWRRLADPALGSEYAYLLHVVRGAEAFHAHGGAADALEGPIRRALLALLASGAASLPAAQWQRFVAEQGVAAALAGTTRPALQRVLAWRSGDVPIDVLRDAATQMSAEAAERRASHAEAAARFGRDLGVVAEDARTLRVELVAATPWFLELTAFFPLFPVPGRLVAERPRDWYLPEHSISNGAFRLTLWRVNDRIRLVRSATYWDRANVGVETIDALPVENATTALNLYLTGGVDWLPSTIPSDLAPRLVGRPDFYRGPGLATYYYRFNVTRPPFDDARVREAIALAIDRREICEDVLGLGQLPATTFVPPGIPGYEPAPSRLGFDPERARRLLAEAGYQDGAGLPEIGILYNTADVHRRIAEVVADQLRRHLGLRVRAYNQEWQAYQASTQAGDYDLARAAWVGDYLDPSTFLELWITNGGNNQTGWGDATYDRLLRAAADVEHFVRTDRALVDAAGESARLQSAVAVFDRSEEPEARREAGVRLRYALLREAEAILVQRGFPIVPVYFYVVSGLVAPHVRGFYPQLVFDDGTRAPNLQHVHPLRAIRIERAAGEGAR